MILYGIEISLWPLIVLGVIFIVTVLLTISINNDRNNYNKSIIELEMRLVKISNEISDIQKENDLYKNENHQANDRLSALEDEYERKYQEQQKSMDEQCRVELQKIRHEQEKNYENFVNSKQIFEYFAEIFAKKIHTPDKKETGNNV